MIVSGSDIRGHLNSGRLIVDPFEERSLGPCDLNIRVSGNYARVVGGEDVVDLHGGVQDASLGRGRFRVETGESFVIHPGERMLMESVEYIELPTNLTCLLGLRSTFSRLGLSTPPTFIDPGFKGKIALLLIGTAYPLKLYADTAIFKAVFMDLGSEGKAYDGKYQFQTGVALPKPDFEWGPPD